MHILDFWIQGDIFSDELIGRMTPLFNDTINHPTIYTKKKRIYQINQQKYTYLLI